MNDLKESGISIAKINTSIAEEKIVIHVENLNLPIINELKSKFPEDMISVVHFEDRVELQHSRTDEIRPLNGGTQITIDGRSNPCTLGFVGQNSSGNNYMITAGHCTDTNDFIEQGGSFIGLTSGSHQGGIHDSATISIPSSIASKYVYEDEPHDRLLSSAEGQDADDVGDPVCKVGHVTGHTCGVISDTDATLGTVLHPMWNQREASYASSAGDSGGTVYYGNTLKGVHVAGSGGNGYYSHVYHILDHWGLSF